MELMGTEMIVFKRLALSLCADVLPSLLHYPRKCSYSTRRESPLTGELGGGRRGESGTKVLRWGRAEDERKKDATRKEGVREKMERVFLAGFNFTVC